MLPFNHNKHHISTTTMPMITKLGRVMTYLEGLPTIKSHVLYKAFDHVVLRDHVTYGNHYKPTTRVAIATKLCRTVICFEGRQTIKSHDRFITRYCETT